ncbi:MAG: Bacterial shufflon protein N-terminal constant region [Pseudomonadota bacterium]
MSRSRRKADQRSRHGGRRGVTLIEGILYLSLAAGMLTFVAQIARDQSERTREKAAAADLALMLAAAQGYAANFYGNLVADTFAAAANADAPLLATVTDLRFLADAGFLGSAYLNQPLAVGETARNAFGQDYAFLMRGVDRAAAEPRPTLTRGMVDANSDGQIDAIWRNGQPADGELELDVLLVTYNSDPLRPAVALPQVRGVRVVGDAERATAGFVTAPATATGAYGAWSLDLGGFAGAAGAPGPGQFASIVALAGADTLETADLREFLRRCDDILAAGLPRTSAAFQACLASQDVYSTIVFTGFDSDGNGTIDRFPDLEGVERIAFAGDTPRLEGLTEIACAAPGGTAVAGTLVLTCPTTQLSGTLGVAGDTTLGGALTAAGPATLGDTLDVAGDTALGGTVTAAGAATLEATLDVAGDSTLGGTLTAEGATQINDTLTVTERATVDRLVLAAHAAGGAPGADLSEAVLDARVVRHDETVAMPTCPANALTGEPMSPRIYAVPVAYRSTAGLPLLAVEARAEANTVARNWRLTLEGRLWRDLDANSEADPAVFTGDDGLILALTRCY